MKNFLSTGATGFVGVNWDGIQSTNWKKDWNKLLPDGKKTS